MKRFLFIFCALMALTIGAFAQQTDSSAALEFSHLFRNSRGTALYELNAYNSSGSTVYLQLYDSYTAAVPAVASTVPGDWNVSTGVVTTEETHATWATGTRAYFLDSDLDPYRASNLTPLISGYNYYLIKLTPSTFKLAASLPDALAGRAITITAAGGTGYTLSVNPRPFLVVPTLTKTVAAAGYNGRRISDGIWAVFSTTDTSYTAATAIGLFDANYR
jgi:hypothetical protein